MRPDKYLIDASVIGYDPAGFQVLYRKRYRPHALYRHLLSFRSGPENSYKLFEVKGCYGPSIQPALLSHMIQKAGGTINGQVIEELEAVWQADLKTIYRAQNLHAQLKASHNSKIIVWLRLFLLLSEFDSIFLLPDAMGERAEALPMKLADLKGNLRRLGGEIDEKMEDVLMGRSNRQKKQWRKARELMLQTIEQHSWNCVEWLKAILFNPGIVMPLSLDELM